MATAAASGVMKMTTSTGQSHHRRGGVQNAGRMNAKSARGGQNRSRSAVMVRAAAGKFDGDRKLKVAVVGGGPSGACAAETLAKGGIETYMIERKLDNCKPCGGAIPLCMIDEFDLPMEIIDRKVQYLGCKLISNIHSISSFMMLTVWNIPYMQ